MKAKTFTVSTPRGTSTGIALIALFALLLVMACGRFMPSRSSSTEPNSNLASPASSPSPSSGSDGYKTLLEKKKELAKMAAPVKLDPKAVIKGKVFIAGDNLASFSDDDKMMYGFADYRKAMSLDEIGTLIQVTCTKGRPLGLYVDKYDKKIKGFASECKVSILDYQAPAVIAQKSFSNAKAPQVIKSIEADLNDEYLMPRPLGDMCSYINSFQVDKEIPTPNILSEKELLRVPVKVELNPSAAIKGKTMVVQRDDRGEIGPFNYMLTTFSSNGTAYGFAGDKLTYQPTELETIIKIDCAKGGPIGKVQNTSEFSSKCEVSLIDYKTLTVFAQKTFENKTLDQEVRKESYPLDWAIDIPKQEIESYLKSFPVS